MRRTLLALALLLAPLPLPGAAFSFTLKYRSATHVYLDAGRAQGLAVGDRLAVVEGGQTVAELEVVFVATQSASCRVVSETRPVRAGDSATPVKKAVEPPAPPPPATRPGSVASPAAPPRASAAPRPWARARGGASFGVYRSWDQTATSLDFRQTTGRLDLGLTELFGQPYSFNLRFRTRQDVRDRALSSRTPREERQDRLYELSLRYEPPAAKLAFEVGRIGTSRFVGVGYLDGALGRVRLARNVQLGGFYGRRADVDAFVADESGQKYGGFLRLGPSGRYAFGSWEAVLALVREFAGDEISREYASLEGRLGTGRRWSFFERVEVDLNRGWRRELSGSGYQLSALSLAANLRVSPSTTASLSYDSRRSYRNHLNQDVPEAIFDDLLHQGLKAGVFMSRTGGFGASAGVGVRLREGDAEATWSANAGLRHQNLFGREVWVGLDGTGFSNLYTDGYVASARAGKRFRAGHTVDLSYGQSLYRLKATMEDRSTHWARLSVRGALTRGLYLLGDLEHDSGDDLKGARVFLEVGYRF